MWPSKKKFQTTDSAAIRLRGEIERRVVEIQDRGVIVSRGFTHVGDYVIQVFFPIDRQNFSHDARVQFKGRSELEFWARVQWEIENALDTVTELALKSERRCGGR